MAMKFSGMIVFSIAVVACQPSLPFVTGSEKINENLQSKTIPHYHVSFQLFKTIHPT
jgi:hypothetical protein